MHALDFEKLSRALPEEGGPYLTSCVPARCCGGVEAGSLEDGNTLEKSAGAHSKGLSEETRHALPLGVGVRNGSSLFGLYAGESTHGSSAAKRCRARLLLARAARPPSDKP